MIFNVCKIIDDSNNEHFFDFIDESGNTLFTDYHWLHSEIELTKDNNENDMDLGRLIGEKKRKKIATIFELRTILEDYIHTVVEILEHVNVLRILGSVADLEKGELQYFCPSNISYYFDCSKLNIDLLVEQLVFDILFDKYLKESKKMKLHDYAKNMSMMISGDINSQNTIYETLRDGMEYNFKLMKYSELREELIKLGINLDKYEQRYRTDNKIKVNPKYVWDYLYYNRYMITYRQFRRQAMRDSNFSYEKLISALQEYDIFVKKLLPVENESPRKYFKKSMEYYYLESYKRIDFMLRLAKAMPKMGITEIDREHFLIKRFHPKVLVPYEKNSKLYFGYSKHNYYRPLFKIEEIIQKQMQFDNKNDHIVYADQLLKYNIVRAKTYELFMYHNEYISSDYEDIKDFIQKCYNMQSYHESDEIWKNIQSVSWKNMDNKTKRWLKPVLRYFNIINDALFWKSPKRKFDLPISSKTEENI